VTGAVYANRPRFAPIGLHLFDPNIGYQMVREEFFLSYGVASRVLGFENEMFGSMTSFLEVVFPALAPEL